MKKIFSQLGQIFMLPIALLPAAGIMLGIGGSFTNPEMISAYGLTFLEQGTILNNFLTILKVCGDIVFANLPLMFAIAVAIGFAKREKGAAALAAVMSFLIMNQAMATTVDVLGLATEDGLIKLFGFEFEGLLSSVLGISGTLSMGVFGGIIAGAFTAVLHNKYYNVELPEFLGFFGGARFVPIIASFAAIFYGIALVFIWPFIGAFLAAIGNGLGSLADAGYGFVASFIFGVVERSLIPFGLHHVFYLPLWQSEVGGVYQICGEAVAGTQNAFFQTLNCGDVTNFPSTNFMTGKFPFMMFGLPAAAYAMYTVADEDKKKETGGMLFSIAFTSFLTGITEPIEFTFLFIAPFLYYGIHVPLAGLSFALMDLLNVKVGQTFSGGFIDFTLFGILPGLTGAENNWFFIPLVGIFYALVYFFLFRWYILKKDLATPGRGKGTVATKDEIKAQKYGSDEEAAQDSNEMTLKIIEALGGADNIETVDACISRLRVSVKDGSLVSDNDTWMSLGAAGVVINGEAIQAVYGAQAAKHKVAIIDELELH